jgi:S-adenosylmethionine:tRNA ribosyltransferase-isomerase
MRPARARPVSFSREKENAFGRSGGKIAVMIEYTLPPDRIAHEPVEPRDHSRLLVLDRESGVMEDHHFYDLPRILRSPRVLIVRNDSKVIPARLIGQKETGGHCEVLLVRREPSSEPADQHWVCLTRPGLKLGQKMQFGATALRAECMASAGHTRTLRFFSSDAARSVTDLLDDIGQTPLPPYISPPDSLSESTLRARYQTIYADAQHPGSVAAPTAGLHFTPAVDAALAEAGVEIAHVTLHVGLGTFQPVTEQHLQSKQLHPEWGEISAEAAAKINRAKAAGIPVLAVGTTSCRILESMADESGRVQAGTTNTQLFIQPGYRFRVVDQLITNFHVSGSSLLYLVSAFTTAPNTTHAFTSFAESPIGKAYDWAIAQQYRFLSFGDAMLIR